jgi:hypothetical protein
MQDYFSAGESSEEETDLDAIIARNNNVIITVDETVDLLDTSQCQDVSRTDAPSHGAGAGPAHPGLGAGPRSDPGIQAMDMSALLLKYNEMTEKMVSLERDRDRFINQSSMSDLLREDRREMLKMAKDDRKRDRSPKEVADEPAMVEMEVKYKDDNHETFSWVTRRQYRQPNKEPHLYWADAQYITEVRPNLREGLVVTHLVPMSLSPKAIGWCHNVKSMLNIRYFTHSQTAVKKQKSSVQVQAGNDGIGTSTMRIGQDWQEASGVSELMEALHNYQACLFSIQPWNWSGLILARVCHEANFFTQVADNEGQQRVILEKFLDEALHRNRTNVVQDKPPLVYKEMLGVAEAVVMNHNGRQAELWKKADAYSAFRMVKSKEAELKRKSDELEDLRTKFNQLKFDHGKCVGGRGGGGGGGYNRGGVGGRGRGRGQHGQQLQEVPDRTWKNNGLTDDKDFVKDRLSVCREYNGPAGCSRTHCSKDHVCNKQSGPGKCCKGPHVASLHP